MISHQQLRTYVIRPALTDINLYSTEAEETLIATAAAETLGGTYLHQIHGPAVSIYEMEPKTYNWVWDIVLTTSDDSSFKNRRPNELGYKILKSCGYSTIPSCDVMAYNLYYATQIARAFWMTVDEPFPSADDLNAIWTLYKKHWNTYSGDTTMKEFLDRYHAYIKG